jgi:hypothetical protein
MCEILKVIVGSCVLLSTFFFVEGCANVKIAQTHNAALNAKQLFEEKYQTLVLEEDRFVHPPHYPYDNVNGLTLVLEANASDEINECETLLGNYSSTQHNPGQAAEDILLECFAKYGATVAGVQMLQGGPVQPGVLPSTIPPQVGDHPMDLREAVLLVKQRQFRTTALYKYRYEGPRDYNAPGLPLKKGAIPMD